MNLLSGMTTLGAMDPVGHVIDHPIGGQWIVSNVTLMLILAAVLTAWVMIRAAGRIQTGGNRTLDDFRTQGIMANGVEFVCVYLRDEVFKPVLGEKTDNYIGILWTFFWFILFCNLLGMVPLIDLTGGLIGLNHHHGFGGTATQSIYVTGALAFLAFLLINGVALWEDPVGYFKHLTGGIPFSIPMLPVILIMVVVELIGIFVKPFALALRLFANMTAGHILLAVLLGFVPMLINGLGLVVGGAMSVLAMAAAFAISLLELLVAFLQAFIFTFLTGLFLGQLVHHADHDHEHAEGGTGGGDHGHH